MGNKSSNSFRDAVQVLKNTKTFPSYKAIADKLQIHPQCLSDIIKHKREVTTKILESSVTDLDINPSYLLTGQGCMFNYQAETEVESEEDSIDFCEIVYVPVAAQAGYFDQANEEFCVSTLPTFKLPADKMMGGKLRCFDVAGQSMYPTFAPGDKIICRQVDQECWKTNIRDNFVYVVIANGSIVVKRLENNIQQLGQLTLLPDNPDFQREIINIEEVREVWTVVMTLHQFKPHSYTERRLKDQEFETMKELLAAHNVEMTPVV